ncbi:unnamed protein product [Rotaria sp. Silwood1]|nr:unnamed protein product [Rotaria sp. Silwood1]
MHEREESYGRGGSLVGKLEEATHIDLNKDGRIGRGYPSFSNYPPTYYPYGGPPPPHPPSNFNQSGNPSLINELEKATNIDLNRDGQIGGGPASFPYYSPPYNPYGGPPPNFNQSSNPGLINELEKATNIDLNRDGRIGGGSAPFSNYPPTYNPYGGPPPLPLPNFNQSGNPGLINELEKATNIDLNRDGRIGSGPAPFQNYPPTYNPYGGPPPPPNFQQSGNPGLINELEKATNIDLNRDGQIGGGPSSFPNYHPPYNPYGGPPPPNFQQSGNPGLINELEKATNIDLNRDGQIGGGPPSFPNYRPPYNPYGGPPPNFNQSSNPGLINELEKATNIDLNRDGQIGGGPASFPYYSPPYNPYGGLPPPPNFQQSGNPGLINELEKATNIDLNRDGRIGSGPAPFPNYNPYSY